MCSRIRHPKSRLRKENWFDWTSRSSRQKKSRKSSSNRCSKIRNWNLLLAKDREKRATDREEEGVDKEKDKTISKETEIIGTIGPVTNPLFGMNLAERRTKRRTMPTGETLRST